MATTTSIVFVHSLQRVNGDTLQPFSVSVSFLGTLPRLPVGSLVSSSSNLRLISMADFNLCVQPLCISVSLPSEYAKYTLPVLSASDVDTQETRVLQFARDIGRLVRTCFKLWTCCRVSDSICRMTTAHKGLKLRLQSRFYPFRRLSRAPARPAGSHSRRSFRLGFSMGP